MNRSQSSGGLLAAAIVFLSSPLSGQEDAARLSTTTPADIGASTGHLPKAHYVPTGPAQNQFPAWVDVSLVFRQDGSLNSTLVPSDYADEHLKPLLTMPRQNGCVQVSGLLQDIVNAPDRESVETATKNSRLVILGTVTEIAFGVHVYMPGELLRVVPDNVIKGQPRNVAAYFVFLPAGNFTLAGVPLCVKDSRYADAPKVGDQVVLFVPDDDANWHGGRAEPYLELLDENGIVTLHSDSTVSLPPRFVAAGDQVLGAYDLLEKVRAAAKGDH